MKRIVLTLAAVSAALSFSQPAQALQRIWNNSSADFNLTSSWNGAIAGNVGAFSSAAATQPNVTANINIVGLFFDGFSGYDVTSSGGFSLTVTGQNTTAGGGESSNSNAAAIAANNTAGINTVDANVILASTTGISTFFQAAGGTLIVNGQVSGTSVVLQLNSASPGGIIRLTGMNSFTGQTQITGSVTASVSTIGNAGANGNLGAATFISFGAGTASGTLLYTGAGETTNKAINLTGTTGGATIDQSGTGLLKFNGTNTATGSGNKALTLQGSTSGTGEIAGTIVNGPSGATRVIKNGTGSWTLSVSDSYSGGTTVNGGTLIASAGGALGTGNVSLTTGAVTLTLGSGGVAQDYISDTATLSYQLTDTINLNFTGSDTIASLVVDGVTLAPGLYGAGGNNPDGVFAGNGFINVVAIPEPATYMLMGFGILVCAQQFRRRKS